jgi:glycosyltransferase involved in cell wall biosynthesis
MQPFLTVGIPTYNRAEHLKERLSELENLDYLKNPEIEIIIHDNNSDDKSHCQLIKNLQARSTNMYLLESSPNIGMVHGCSKILEAARGQWITLLGDDDPIVIKSCDFLRLIRKNKKCDHLYFRTKEYENGQARKVSWFPKLKAGNYRPIEICAKTGLTTHFAHLAAHCFRNRKNLAKIWIQSHKRCMSYGHCIMFLENYKSSFFSGKTVAAWRSGNERVSSQMNILLNMELRNLFKYPPTKTIKKLIKLNPSNVRKEGSFPLISCINNPELKFIDQVEFLPKDERITLQDVRPQKFNPKDDVYIYPTGKSKSRHFSCVFYRDNGKTNRKSFNNAAVVYMCGPSARFESICDIVRKMELSGKIFLDGKAVSPLMLLSEYCKAGMRKKTWKMRAYAIVLFSVLMYGVEEFNITRIIFNYFKRPQKNFYGFVRSLERTCRITLKKMLSSRNKKIRKHIHFRRGFSATTE